jgi:hypothetical protein
VEGPCWRPSIISRVRSGDLRGSLSTASREAGGGKDGGGEDLKRIEAEKA